MDSEFGKGFLYPLGLFLGHSMVQFQGIPGSSGAWLVLSGAKDHLYEFDPELAPTDEMKERARRLKEAAMERYDSEHWNDKEGKAVLKELFEEAKELLFLADRHYGNEPVRAKFS